MVSDRNGDDRDKAAGFLILRLFFAQFWLLQFWGKIYDQESRIAAWRNLSIWAGHTADWFVKLTVLPGWAVRPYALALPYAELALGLLWLLGWRARGAAIASALLIVSLDFGLMHQLKHDVVASNSIHLGLLLLALQWQKHDRWSIDSRLARR